MNVVFQKDGFESLQTMRSLKQDRRFPNEGGIVHQSKSKSAAGGRKDLVSEKGVQGIGRGSAHVVGQLQEMIGIRERGGRGFRKEDSRGVDVGNVGSVKGALVYKGLLLVFSSREFEKGSKRDGRRLAIMGNVDGTGKRGVGDAQRGPVGMNAHGAGPHDDGGISRDTHEGSRFGQTCLDVDRVTSWKMCGMQNQVVDNHVIGGFADEERGYGGSHRSTGDVFGRAAVRGKETNGFGERDGQVLLADHEIIRQFDRIVGTGGGDGGEEFGLGATCRGRASAERGKRNLDGGHGRGWSGCVLLVDVSRPGLQIHVGRTDGS